VAKVFLLAGLFAGLASCGPREFSDVTNVPPTYGNDAGQDSARADAPLPPAADAPAEAPSGDEAEPTPDAGVDAPSQPDLAPPPPSPMDAAPEQAPQDLRPEVNEVAATAQARCPRGACKLVFVTSTPLPSGLFGGFAPAQATCQRLADAAGFGRSFQPWLSDSGGSPGSRFARGNQRYALVDGTVVASNFGALVSGQLAHAIDRFETGAAVSSTTFLEVWTGTTATGTASGSTCGDWKDATIAQHGLVGLANQFDLRWTEAYTQFCDRADIHLYCVEQ
jgi:hypothetical protein